MARLRVREVAESKGIGLNKLSRIADISIITVRKMWRDPTYNPSLSTLQKLALALDVPIEDLFIPDDPPASR